MDCVNLVLDDEQLERLADLVAARLQAPARAEHAASLVSAAELALRLSVSRQTVYQHAAELGGQRVGTGPRARWRFDVEEAREAMHCLTSRQPELEKASGDGLSEDTRPRRRSRMPNGMPAAGSILTSRPRRTNV